MIEVGKYYCGKNGGISVLIKDMKNGYATYQYVFSDGVLLSEKHDHCLPIHYLEEEYCMENDFLNEEEIEEFEQTIDF